MLKRMIYVLVLFLKWVIWKALFYKPILFLNLYPNEKILDKTKLKAIADDKLNITVMMISLFDRVENTVGKWENAGYQHFFLFLQRFPKLSSLGTLKVGIV